MVSGKWIPRVRKITSSPLLTLRGEMDDDASVMDE